MNAGNKGNKWTVVSFEDGTNPGENSTVGREPHGVNDGEHIQSNLPVVERFEGVISDSLVVNEMQGNKGFMTTWKVTKRPRTKKEQTGSTHVTQSLRQQAVKEQKAQQINQPGIFSASSNMHEEATSDLEREARGQFEIALQLSQKITTDKKEEPKVRKTLPIRDLLT
jgi:cobalamin biosynthesis Mg chelatase CobN